MQSLAPLALRRALVAGALTATTLVSGCAAFSEDAPSGDGLRIAAGFYPLEYVAQRVAGDLATVEVLTSPGTEPHDLELKIAQTALLAEADLVIHERGFQPAVDAAADQNATGEVLDAADAVGLEPADAHAGGDSEKHTEDDGHDHGDLDPHFWQDPLRMADLADAVAADLADLDPGHADIYTANAESLRTDLEELDAAYADGLAHCEISTVVVSHDAFGYLSKYGLDMEPITGLSPEAEPTPRDIARLQSLITEEGVTTVFSERLAPRQLTASLAGDLDLETAVLDPVEGLTDETADDDYLSLMEQNLDALRTANGCR